MAPFCIYFADANNPHHEPEVGLRRHDIATDGFFAYIMTNYRYHTVVKSPVIDLDSGQFPNWHLWQHFSIYNVMSTEIL